MRTGKDNATVAALIVSLLMGAIAVGAQSTAATGGGGSASVQLSESISVEILTPTGPPSSKAKQRLEEREGSRPQQDLPPPKEPEHAVEKEEEKQQEKSNKIVSNLRSAWERNDVNGVASVLSASGNVDALAKGFRFDGKDREQVLQKSDDRDEDPDVVSIKGIAKSALDTGDVNKLAAVMVVSTLGKRDAKIEAELIKILSDRKLMQAVLNADADKQFIPRDEIKEQPQETPYPLATAISTSEIWTSGEGSEAFAAGQASASVKHGSPGGGRRLASGFNLTRRSLKCDGCSPANSLVCAHCWARDVCAPFHWC